MDAPKSTPTPLAAAVLLATLAGALVFAGRGIQEARRGGERLTAKLLSVAARDNEAIPFELPKLDGGTVSLASFQDKVVLVNFWATWCPPCVEEMPSLVRMHDRLKGDPRFVMLAVSADESWDPVSRFFAGERPGFTVLLDKKGEMAKRYGTTMFPETYVVKNGKVIGFIEGPRRWDDWYVEKYLRGLLDGA
ncbi:MAG: TlpA disulfide reductase family protein [Myxococcota bacterium]